MAVIAKLDGIEYPVRTISGNGSNVFTNFDDTPPKALIEMSGDNMAHELIAVLNGVEQERWVVIFGGHHSDYTPAEVISYISWNVMTYEVIE